MLTPAELDELKTARQLIESEGLAVRLQNIVGKPIMEGVNWLPKGWRAKVNTATEAALKKALDVAIKSLDKTGPARARANKSHKMMAAASGAFGGAFGLPALVVELPVSTTIMMRSIADIAQSEGEDLTTIEARLACVEVFALGGTGQNDDYADTGYYAVRTILAQQVTETIRHLAQGGAARVSATPIARLIASVASRFGVVVGEKALAAAIPIVGAAGGAMINTLFIDHFQSVARGHFIIRRLERTHGHDVVRAAFEAL
jgi:hypothetical protein